MNNGGLLGKPAGINPLPPREMQAWMQRQRGLVQQAQAIRLRTASLARLEEQIAAHCRQLQTCLEGLVENPVRIALRDDPNCANFDALLARGDLVLDRIKEAIETRRQLERENNRLTKAVAQAEAKTIQAENDLNQWRTQWMAAIRILRLPDETPPVAVNEVIAQTAELFARLKEAAGYAERIEGITRDSLRFRQDVQRQLLSIDADLTVQADGFQEGLENLMVRLRRAITEQKNFDLLQSQRKKHEEKRLQAHTTVETLRARLTLLCQEARCQNPEELPAAEAASAEVLHLRQEREACHRQLLQLAAGRNDRRPLSVEAATISADSLPGELQAYRRQRFRPESRNAHAASCARPSAVKKPS